MARKLKGLGPIKLSPVCEQLDFDRMVIQYFVWFAGVPVLIGWNWLL